MDLGSDKKSLASLASDRVLPIPDTQLNQTNQWYTSNPESSNLVVPIPHDERMDYI